ncbi:NAD(P)-dependent dehydrogenase (short-subunit alcohol dehydrogenase family) [Nonlabens dokdonensis]|jgi:NAD(P)-dependent dehydrogenase (short-subunit alcohol dehydrogenase family)|uniref:NAD(P)-dependent dehydrogenase (Short-subunit alcohol dehydrogenase family) n=2 Tax=Nonlabens dokdonensis TaxID=328515 RepID=A0ABX5PZ57_9FLAO|nr:SDR family oxidoreductase [Nonlabens dokdonensis]AGC77145.1 putative short-chain dehydrogenase [Nonlabens dokdonensis DSW-6]PZX41104.1 NAD(P)-dependent dehydrogenase (short-subunit alcohol dehydrogenase family) [Nonlabens dokdonensis]
MSKRVIVTGASRGIGFEMIQLFANAGHEVIALSRKIDAIQSLDNTSIQAIATDLSAQSSIEETAKTILTKWDRIDIVIHNAGMLVNKPFQELTPEDFQQCYAVNIFGVASLTQALLPALTKDSHVVAISSMGGIQGSAKFPGLAAYSSAKGAVITLFELLAEEYKENGPSFNTLALGAVQTEMLEEAFPGYQAPLTAPEMASYIMNFALTGNKFYNGKVLQVSASTP